MDIRFVLILFCFLLSGFAALLYQTAWTRQLSFVFGTSELAVATVLAAYFGGLTAGAAAAARWAGRVRRPILVYGLLELGIAVTALAVPLLMGVATRLYVRLFGDSFAPAETGDTAAALFYLACSFVVLFLPTAFMGATLPLLARHAVRTDRQIGPRVGLLYAINTAGAVLGTLTTAFVLLPATGLSFTVWVGVLLNTGVFVLAVVIARGSEVLADDAAEDARIVESRSLPGARRLILPVMLISGAVSFTYEILWTRLLGHILGASVYAFATMLASFLIGIAVGSAIAARFARDARLAGQGFVVVQFGVGVLSWFAYVLVDRMPELAARLGAGGTASLAVNALIAGLILLPGALCIGATFPLAVRILAAHAGEAGVVSARVYAWNTIGAIVGSVGTGFFILPALGFTDTLTAAVMVNFILAGCVALIVHAGVPFSPPLKKSFDGRPAAGGRGPMAGSGLRFPWLVRGGPLVGAALVLVVTAAVFRPATPWNVLRASPMGEPTEGIGIAYFAVGRGSTVLLTDDGVKWGLRTNGLPEAGIRRRGVRLMQYGGAMPWLSALPCLVRPEARSMFVVGLGGGVALEVVPQSIESIDVVELDPEVIAANRRIAGERAIDPLADPRLNLFVNDARGALLLTRRQYDLMVSQPSHPWTAGAANLFTREFYELARRRLSPEGVFVQWMALGFVDEPLMQSLVATLGSVFDHVHVYRPLRGEVLLLASNAPMNVWEQAPRGLAVDPEAYAQVGILTPEDVWLALYMDEMGARKFAAGAKLITDDSNILQVRSPGALREHSRRRTVDEGYLAAYDVLHQPPATMNHLYALRRLLHAREGVRVNTLLSHIPDPVERLIGRALMHQARGETAAAEARLLEALKIDPNSETARFLQIQLRGSEFLSGDQALNDMAAGLSGPRRAILEGWKLEREKRWDTLKALDSRLAQVSPHDDGYADALALRAAWRIKAGDEAAALDAIVMLDRLNATFGTEQDLLLRAEASLKVNEWYGACATLAEVAGRLSPGGKHLKTAQALNDLVRAVPPIPGLRHGLRQLATRSELLLR